MNLFELNWQGVDAGEGFWENAIGLFGKLGAEESLLTKIKSYRDRAITPDTKVTEITTKEETWLKWLGANHCFSTWKT